MTTSNELLQAALYYTNQGLPIFPLHYVNSDGKCSCGKVDCDSRGKHPRTNHGFKDATTDPNQIKEWWSEWPDANIGLPTGRQSGLVVIDSDEKNGKSGYKSISEARLKMPDTRIVGTPSGGSHYYYQYPEGQDIGCSAGVLDGVDIRGDGGYVVAPPSVIDGKPYTVVSTSGVTPFPSPWAGLLTKRQPPVVQSDSEPIMEGLRDNTLASLGGKLRFSALSYEEIRAALLVINERRCVPPKEVGEVERIARSVSRYEPGDYTAFVDFSGFRPPLPGDSLPLTLSRVEIGDLTPDVVLPPLEFVVERRLPVGVPTLLASHGGVGKSKLGLQMAVCVTAGLDFMGLETMRVPVTVFSAEDSELDLRHRLKQVFTHYHVDPKSVVDLLDVRDVTEVNAALYKEYVMDGARSGNTTPVYNALLDACKQNSSRFVIIDNASDVFEANENDRSLVRGFMRSLGQLAREINGAVLLLAHVNKMTAKTGMRAESYSGSTAWHNSSRSRLSLTETDGQLTLSHDKSNRGVRGQDIPLSWTGEGLLEFGHVTFDGIQDGPDLDQLVNMIKEKSEQGTPVSTSRTGGNAYVVLSPLDGFPAGMDRKRFWRLIDRALKDGCLRITELRTKHGNSQKVFETVG